MKSEHPFLVPLPASIECNQTGYYPSINRYEKQLPSHIRVHCVERLRDFVQPLSTYHDIAARIQGLLQSGYNHRNPLSTDYIYRTRSENLLVLKSTKIEGTKASLIGISGTGKSVAVERILKVQYPQTFSQHERIAFEQVIWLKINCPFNPTIKTLCTEILAEMDRILYTSYSALFIWMNEEDLMIQVTKLLWLHGIGLLIIDEIQQIKYIQNKPRQELMTYLNDLTSFIGIPVLLIGTPLALPLLPGTFLEENLVHWKPLKLSNDWDIFVQRLFEKQWTDEDAKLTHYFAAKLHNIACGIIDIAIKIYIAAQQFCINRNIKCITPEILDIVSQERFLLMKPMLNALHNGLENELQQYPDLLYGTIRKKG